MYRRLRTTGRVLLSSAGLAPLLLSCVVHAAPAPPELAPDGYAGFPSLHAPGLLAATQQGYLGVNVRDVDLEHASKEKLSTPVGAEVVSLDHDAPAAKAGVHTGDIIQSLNGQIVADAATLTRLLRDMPVGKAIELQVIHAGKVALVHLQLADRSALVQHAWSHHFRVPLPESAPTVQGFVAQQSFPGGGGGSAASDSPDAEAYVGAQVEPLTRQLAKFFGSHAGNGLLVRSVEDKSPAFAAGLEAGDVILNANGQAVETTAEWLQVLRTNAGHPVPVTVLRNRKVLSLAITVDNRITQSELVVPEQVKRLRFGL